MEGASAGGRNPAEMLMDYVKRAPPPEDAGLLEAEPSAPGAFDLAASMMRGAGAGAMLECNPLEVARQQGYHFYVHLLRNLLILKNTKSQQFIALVRNIVVGLARLRLAHLFGACCCRLRCSSRPSAALTLSCASRQNPPHALQSTIPSNVFG